MIYLDANHVYTDDTGKKYTGINEFAKLVGKAEDYSFIDPAVLQLSCDYGSAIHDLAESIIEKRQFYPKHNYPTKPSYQEQKAKIEAFLSEQRVSVVECELILADEVNLLAGKVDLIAKIGNQLTIVDWKTNNKVNDFVMAGYVYLANLNGIFVTRSLAVGLKNKSYKIIEVMDLFAKKKEFEEILTGIQI